MPSAEPIMVFLFFPWTHPSSANKSRRTNQVLAGADPARRSHPEGDVGSFRVGHGDRRAERLAAPRAAPRRVAGAAAGRSRELHPDAWPRSSSRETSGVRSVPFAAETTGSRGSCPTDPYRDPVIPGPVRLDPLGTNSVSIHLLRGYVDR